MKKFFSLFAAVLFASSMMATTYGAVKATEVKAGELYVFVQTCDEATTAMSNSIASGKAAVTADFLKTGFAGDEAYVWTVEAAEGGWNIKSANDSKYLNNTNKGNLTADAAASSVWDITISGDFALITNTGNSRFLGLNDNRDSYKAYSSDNMANYPHDIVIWKLVEGGEGSIEAAEGGSQGGGAEHEGGKLDVVYAEAVYFADYAAWQLNFYKDYQSGQITYPDVYVGMQQKTATTLAGTYTEDEIAYVQVFFAEKDSVDALTFDTDLVITCTGEGQYHVQLTFGGDDSKTHILDWEGEFEYVYDYDTDADIELEDEPTQGIEDIKLTEKAQKVSVDGAVYVIRDNKMYNVTGTRVR